jgi:hypothetical protein
MLNLVFSLFSGCQSLFVLTINARFFYNLVNKFISTSVNRNILMSILRMLPLKFGHQERNA